MIEIFSLLCTGTRKKKRGTRRERGNAGVIRNAFARNENALLARKRKVRTKSGSGKENQMETKEILRFVLYLQKHYSETMGISFSVSLHRKHPETQCFFFVFFFLPTDH